MVRDCFIASARVGVSQSSGGLKLKPSRPRSARVIAAGLAHTFATPPPPQESAPLQRPQSAVRALPHESEPLTTPQSLPSRAQNARSVSLGQPQTLAVPAPPQLPGA